MDHSPISCAGLGNKFHVQQLACNALQEMRIAERLKAIKQGNKERDLAKESGMKLKHKHKLTT